MILLITRFRFGLGIVLMLIAIFLSMKTISAQTPDVQIETGAWLFAENCAVCHGANGEGRIGATLSKDWPSIRPDLTVKSIIEMGVPGTAMPAWSMDYGGPLSKTDLEFLVTYILSWQSGDAPVIFTPQESPTARPPISPLPDIEGDPNLGGVLFDQNCAVCHGSEGEGRIGATLAKAWPGLRPDLSIKTTIQNGVLNTVMPAWSQDKGGPLNETEIEDIVSFILSRSDFPESQAAYSISTSTPQPFPWLRGWGGILFFFVLLVLFISAALYLQRRKSNIE